MLSKQHKESDRKSLARSHKEKDMQQGPNQEGKTQEETFWNIEEEIYKEQLIENKIKISRSSANQCQLNESGGRHQKRKP